ncbi:M56 family metallopeptidase [Agreia pratensis]|uniref:M56 family metallopeptidase n=1 Tax=Agreia pratensis TaxID=150121 RepID=UPI00188B3E50|nr:M56 family metallopeptidase [Agreia pratensis]MBF4633750.1 M56 family metallopeptidase [Agreia pratensis]
MTGAWVGLAVLALALAWPVPIALSKAAWPARAPGTALALWQAVALSGGLSMIGALLAFGLTPFENDLGVASNLLSGHLLDGALPTQTGALQIVSLAGAVVLGVHLVLSLATTAANTARERRRHRALIELLSSPLQGSPGTRMLDFPAPVAYCLPGVRSITVLTEGLVRVLDAAQLRAVLAHERAHLRQYHHLVLLAFKAWNIALPWFPIANRAEKAVALLVEMLADDDARREVDDASLATAIAIVGSPWRDVDPAAAPIAADEIVPEADPETLGARVSRLISPPGSLTRAARALVLASGVALVAAPVAVLVALL